LEDLIGAVKCLQRDGLPIPKVNKNDIIQEARLAGPRWHHMGAS